VQPLWIGRYIGDAKRCVTTGTAGFDTATRVATFSLSQSGTWSGSPSRRVSGGITAENFWNSIWFRAFWFNLVAVFCRPPDPVHLYLCNKNYSVFTSKNAEFILGLLLLLLLLLIYRHFDFTLKSGTFGPNPGRVATLTATNTLFDPDLPGGSSGLGAGPPGEVWYIREQTNFLYKRILH